MFSLLNIFNDGKDLSFHKSSKSRTLPQKTKAQEVTEQQARGVLEAVVHTILFQRAVGHVTPEEATLDFLDSFYYVQQWSNI